MIKMQAQQNHTCVEWLFAIRDAWHPVENNEKQTAFHGVNDLYKSFAFNE